MEDRTVPAHAIAVGPDLSLASFGPNSGARVGDSLYFIGHQSTDALGVSEVWQVNGGTTAQEVNAPALAGMTIGEIQNVNGTLYVTASQPQAPPPFLPLATPPTFNVWKLDPTAPGGAVQLTNLTGVGATNLQAVGDKLIFQTMPFTGSVPTQTGGSLWVSDGTAAGTTQLFMFPGNAHPNLFNSVSAGGELYFPVGPLTTPTAPTLWVTDGTALGTHAVTGPTASLTGFTMKAVGDTAYVIGANGNQLQLWTATNGTATQVSSFNTNGNDSGGPLVTGITTAGGKVYFAINQASGDQVWSSDGTSAGTTLLAQLPGAIPLPDPSGPPTRLPAYIDSIAVLNGDVYFTVANGGGLMKADGQGGANAVSLPAGLSGVSSVSAVDGRLFFNADDNVHGTEMWTTDGTTAGTVRLSDINPGSGSSFPIGPEEAGGGFYVAASDGVPQGPATFSQMQVWKLPDPSAPAGAGATTTLTSSAANVTTGGPITLTATVKAADATQPTPTGQVVFRDDEQIYGSAPLVNGVATLATSISVPGSHNIEAVYTGDSTFDESISAPVTVSAGPSSTTVDLTTSDATADPGEMVTFTAEVTPALPASQPPTGSVNFFDGTNFLGTGALDNGTAMVQTGSLAPGQHSITAVYGGDTSFSPSRSAPLAESVGPQVTVGLTVPQSGPTLGQSLTIAAHVAAAGGSLPSGTTVIFRDAATPLGTVAVNALGNASLTISNLGVGAHSLSAAVFNGGAEFDSPAVAVTVKPAATSMTLRSTDPTARLGESITLTALIATPTTGLPPATGTVTFKDAQTVLGTAPVANGRAALLVRNLAAGSHPITASYPGDKNYGGASAALTQTVTGATVGTTITVSASDTSAVVGEQIALSAKITPAVGTATPVGTVTFRDGSALLGAVNIDPSGKALLLTRSLSLGDHKITATFRGAGIFAGSTSAPLTVSERLGANAKLTAATSAIVAGQSVPLTATVTPAAGGAVQPAGSVTFHDGATVLGTAPLQNGVARFTAGPFTTVAIHRLTAVYSGNAMFASTTTGVANLNVRADRTTTTLVPPAPPAAGTGAVTLTVKVGVVAPGTGTPTGKVTFLSGGTVLGTASVVGGTATLHLAKLAAGSYNLRAAFAGTGPYASSSSAIVRYTIQAATSTTLQASAAAFGQPTVLKATVAVLSPGINKATGRVTFKDRATILGTAAVANGVATLGVKLPTGPHALTASYGGTTDFAGSATAPLAYSVAKAAPVMSLHVTSITPKSGASVTLRVDIDPATVGVVGPTGSVLLLDGTTILGSGPIAHGAVVVQTSRLTKGTNTLTATYGGDGNYLARSAHLIVTAT
jgi:ELWxxDGT repeat protein